MNKKILSVVLILCVMLAVMPMTAYAADIAFCTKCNKIQTVRVTYQYADDKLHKCSVTCTVCYNKWYYGESHIWSGTATCTSGRTCMVCGGSSEPLGHDWGAWTQNSEIGRAPVCTPGAAQNHVCGLSRGDTEGGGRGGGGGGGFCKGFALLSIMIKNLQDLNN